MLPSLFPEADSRPAAILALADGTIFRGVSIGASGHCVAPLAMDTAMAGYQEVMASPAYNGCILTLTYPHIGNIGIDDTQAAPAQMVAGLVVRDCPHHFFHFGASLSLPHYLARQGIVAIADIDTRKLARLLRKGAQQGCIYVGEDPLQALALLGVQPAGPVTQFTDAPENG